MRKRKSLIKMFIVILLLSGGTAKAQLDGLLQKAKEKAGDVIEKKVEKKAAGDSSSKSSRTVINTATDFRQGDSLIFSEDFSKNKTGTSATSFKTNGAAIVATADGQNGKWMVLQDKATFKLSKALAYPKRFTVEFDILAMADKITDISPLSFGFATDNSVREYTSNAGAYVELHYYDANQVNVGNSNPKKYVNTTYDLAADLNRPLHIAVTVDGERMVVYLNNVKLADTVLFMPSGAKNFYISAPWEYKDGARVLMSNLKIYGFSK